MNYAVKLIYVLLRSLLIKYCFDWFIVAKFNIAALTGIQAIGISSFLYFMEIIKHDFNEFKMSMALIDQKSTEEQKEIYSRELADKNLFDIVANCLNVLAGLAICYILHLFM
ncbi:MAG: hypothetical protein LC122_12290 [Chitinophagales bacterium]|nr:hypothetical protein [Chitinophagales bacterium]